MIVILRLRLRARKLLVFFEKPSRMLFFLPGLTVYLALARIVEPAADDLAPELLAPGSSA